MSRRILVTGSREWPDWRVVYDALNEHVETGDVVVHGDNGNADRMARRWCILTGTDQEPHPANWKLSGRAAGVLRNGYMIDLGADLCLAFPLGESRGTRDCMRRAEAAGIPVINYGD